MKVIEWNAGNARKWRVKRDLRRLLKTRPFAVQLVEVHDRRDALAWAAKRFGYDLIQFAGPALGHCALLIRADGMAHNPRTHQLNDRTFVGRDVAGAADNGFTAEKHIVAVDATGPRGRQVTIAVCHFVPSASKSDRAAELLDLQAKRAAAWLHGQLLPADLAMDANGKSTRPEFAPLRRVATPYSAPSRKGEPIDIHWLTQGTAMTTPHPTSSDHDAVEADIDWHRDAHA